MSTWIHHKVVCKCFGGGSLITYSDKEEHDFVVENLIKKDPLYEGIYTIITSKIQLINSGLQELLTQQ